MAIHHHGAMREPGTVPSLENIFPSIIRFFPLEKVGLTQWENGDIEQSQGCQLE
jgi:hypothetical protein